MRRMITNKQVVDVVNKAIEDGEIEMEGGLPEIEEGDAGKVLKVNEQEDGVEWAEDGSGNALVLPEEAPSEIELVVVDTSGEQNSLTVGDGLEIANGELKASQKVLVLDFNSASSLTDETAKTALTAGTYDLVRVLNYSQPGHNFEFEKTYLSSISVSSAVANTIPSIAYSTSPRYILLKNNSKIAFNNSSAAKSYGLIPALGVYTAYPKPGFRVELQYAGSALKIVCTNSTTLDDFTPMEYTSQVLQLAGGTLSSGNYPMLDYQWNGKPRPFNNLTYEVVDSDVDANAHIIMRVSRYDFTNKTIYIFGQYINDTTGAVTASYTGTINCTNGVYTITKH